MTVTWTGGAGGWDDAGNWTPMQIPGAGDDVVISGPGNEVGISGADTAHTVTISAAGGAVFLDGSLTLAGTGAALTVQAGDFQIDQTGVLSGGVLSNPGGTIFYEGGTVDAITYDGVMDVTGGSVVVKGGLTLAGANGAGQGELDVGPEGVTFVNGQTISGGTVDLGSQGRLYGGVDAGGGIATSQYLTLAPDVTLKIRDGDGIDLDAVGDGPLGLINQGTIDVYGSFASISGASLSNAGTINVGGGGYFDLYGDIVNSGAINVTSGTTVDVYGPSLTNTSGASITVDHGGLNFGVSDVTNDGVITVDSGSVTLTVGADSHYGALTITNSSIGLYGSVTTGQFLGWLAGNSDYVGVLGTLINTGAAFGGGAAPTYAIGSTNQMATIVGGTLVGNGGDSGITNAELDGVTINGQMDLGGAALVVGGLSFTSQNGVDPGGLKIFDASTLTLQGSQTLDDGKLELAGDQSAVLVDISPSDYAANGNAGMPQTLTLGSGLVIDQTGTAGKLGGGGGGNEFGLVDLVNHGLIEAQAGTLLVQGTESFESDGTILAASGAVLTVQGTTLVNTGAVEVDAASTLNVQGLDNEATVQLQGGTLNAQNLTGGGTIIGFGLLDIASGLSGSVEASGGRLNVLKANASATLTIDTGAALAFLDSSAGTVNFAGAGTLSLLKPDAFTGTIGALADGATIDLAGVSALGPVVIAGTQATIRTTGGLVTLNFASAPDAFTVKSDGSGGTDLVYVDGPVLTTTSGDQTIVQRFDPGFQQIAAEVTTTDPAMTTVQEFDGAWNQLAAVRTLAEPDGGVVVEDFDGGWNLTGATVTSHPDAQTTVVQQFDKAWGQISATLTNVTGDVTTVQDFNGAWSMTGATRTAVSGNQTVEQMFDSAWAQTGATVTTDLGAGGLVTQAYDAGWTQIGAEVVTALPGQAQDATFDGDWTLLSKVETADGAGARTWFDFGRTAAETFDSAADHATTFVFSPGQVAGDTFNGLNTFAAGGALHDVLEFTGYGPGATLTQASATTWTIAAAGHASETFNVAAGTALAAGDYVFG